MIEPCPFCGSKTRTLETGTISLKRSGKFEPDTTSCCGAQEKNLRYMRKRYGKDSGQAPDMSEVEKL